MTIENGDVLRVVIDHLLDDGTITNLVFHYLANLETPQANGTALNQLEEFVERFFGEVEERIHSGSALGALEVNKVAFNEETAQWEVSEYIGTRYPTVTFTNAGEQLPNQNAAVLVAKTTRPKSYGKKFFAGMTETDSTGSEWNAYTLTDMAAALLEYLLDIELAPSNTLTPGVPRSKFDVFLPFTTGIVDYIVGSQRRRKPGVGE
jgi:hypothetical protein